MKRATKPAQGNRTQDLPAGERPRRWRTPPELWARKEFARKATNSQTWNELLSINQYPVQFFTRGRRNSIGRIAKLPSVPQCGACVSLRCLLSLRWFSWLAARLPKRMPTLLPEKPDAVIDLATKEGVDLVKGQWRYSDTKIIQVDFKAAGPDKQPTGKPIKTYDFTPHAGGADFDDSKWEMLDPTTLDARRSTGRLCFNWYRINITIPRACKRCRSCGCDRGFRDVDR